MARQSQSRLMFHARLRFYLNRLGERLWIKPLMICALSIAAVFIATLADDLGWAEYHLPAVSEESVEKLLSIVSSSMLVLAALAVGAMLSAYASASSIATPRAFALVVADDVSQNALSTFIGAFIFSIVALIALMNEIYGTAGRFVLFSFTLLAFIIVIFNFVRWIDRIARLGRMGSIIARVEKATGSALVMQARLPLLGARKATATPDGLDIFASELGYIQRVDVAALQQVAERYEIVIALRTMAGSLVTPDQPLACVRDYRDESLEDELSDAISSCFVIGKERTFDEDPRFGFTVLSEIASRALSPAVNDPGTAIDIIATELRLFHLWVTEQQETEPGSVECDRVEVPPFDTEALFRDAFSAVARDGAAYVEVGIALQKALKALAAFEGKHLGELAQATSLYALQHAESALVLHADIEALRAQAAQL